MIGVFTCLDTQIISVPIDSPSQSKQSSSQGAVHESIVSSLASEGWCVVSDFLPRSFIAELRSESEIDWKAGEFRKAGIGRGTGFNRDQGIRNDQIKWLDPLRCTDLQQLYLGVMEELRKAINSSLYLGLFDLESHLSVYAPGSFYRRHIDRFRGSSRRILSCVLYLNEDWKAEDGGQLRLYCNPQDEGEYQDILPLGGRFVCFLSSRFPHEVLPARRMRFSLTGWYRTREPVFVY